MQSIWSTLPLEQLTVPVLKEELRAQGQRVTGNKAELISRLYSLNSYPITEPLLALLPVETISSPEVKLTVDGTSVSIPRADLLQLFPGSLITDALTQYPGTDDITINQPSVTPAVLRALQTLATAPGSPRDAYEPADYAAASSYLRIPALNTLAT